MSWRSFSNRAASCSCASPLPLDRLSVLLKSSNFLRLLRNSRPSGVTESVGNSPVARVDQAPFDELVRDVDQLIFRRVSGDAVDGQPVVAQLQNALGAAAPEHVHDVARRRIAHRCELLRRALSGQSPCRRRRCRQGRALRSPGSGRRRRSCLAPIARRSSPGETCGGTSYRLRTRPSLRASPSRPPAPVRSLSWSIK